MCYRFVAIALTVAVLLGAGIWVASAYANRERVITRIAWVSACFAVLSVAIACFLQTLPKETKEYWGYPLVAFWVAAPPLWFFFEYL